MGVFIGLYNSISITFDSTEVWVPHTLAFTLTVPAVVPLGTRVMELLVLLPDQPLGFVQV